MPVLLVHPMWGGDLEGERAALPANWELTTDPTRAEDAAAVVFHLPELDVDRFAGAPKPAGQVWVGWTMEASAYYPHQDAPAVRDRLDLLMTHRLDSDVPVPFVGPYWRALMDAEPVTDANGRGMVAAVVSSPNDRSGRLGYLRELMRHVDVASYGAQLNTAGPVPDDDGSASAKVALLRRYRFTLAFENALEDGYVTEKLYQPLVAGSVPVYLGAPVDARLIPGVGCFIDAARFEPAALADLLKNATVADDARYLRWRHASRSAAFRALGRVAETHPFARLCRLLDDRGRLEPRRA